MREFRGAAVAILSDLVFSHGSLDPIRVPTNSEPRVLSMACMIWERFLEFLPCIGIGFEALIDLHTIGSRGMCKQAWGRADRSTASSAAGLF